MDISHGLGSNNGVNSLLTQTIGQYKKVLVLAVGGGNDSVSTLLLQQQLNKRFGYGPEYIDIVAVLPDCIDYHHSTKTNHHLLSIINENTTRSVNGKSINAFPERILSQHKNIIPALKIKNIYGISMWQGSYGVLSALTYLVDSEGYDLILSIDVGGDFIACESNVEVLSPMMDGYMLYALKELKTYIEARSLKTEMLYCVFGLGTDGESTPAMLDEALSMLPGVEEHLFAKEDIQPFINFYRNIVEKNRYSRTTDYTILEICNEHHDNPSQFRGRFHVKKSQDEKSEVYYGDFSHLQDTKFYGKYYLFEDIGKIQNKYSKGCGSGIEWFLHVQKEETKINHELNGQSYQDIGLLLNQDELKNHSLFFGTPSRKFDDKQQIEIIKDINTSILNKVYDFAFIYSELIGFIDQSIYHLKINDDISVISLNQSKMNTLFNRCKD